MNKLLAVMAFVLVNAFTMNLPALAVPAVNANLQQATAQIPIPGINAAVTELYNSLQKIPGTNNFMAKKTFNVPSLGDVPLQLYVFGTTPQQTVLLVLNRSIKLPNALPKNTLKLLDGTSITDPIFSLSTVDFTLPVSSMPVELQQIVRDSYFNAGSLDFPSGIQVTSRASIKGILGETIRLGMGVPVQDFIMRAGVVLPVPADVRSGAGLLLLMPKSPKDLPAGQVEFQLAPGKTIPNPMGMQGVVLSDATISITSELVLGYTGNVAIAGTNAKFITFFETPLNVVGAIDLLDFKFGLSSQTVTLADVAVLGMSMQVSTVPGAGYLIKGLDKYTAPLKLALTPLSVFQLTNPVSVPDYKVGDAAHPFPAVSAFNILVFGPLSNVDNTPGPLLKVFGNARVLGQQVGSMNVYMSAGGLHGKISEGLNLKLGPLGRQGISMTENADISDKVFSLGMHGNVLGRALDVDMDSSSLTLNSPATCATPFALSANVAIQPQLNVSDLLDSLPGVNVNPAQIAACTGAALNSALQWVGGSSLSGYSSGEAIIAYEGLRSFDTSVVKTWQSLGVNGGGDAVRGGLKKAGNAINKATCRLVHNCKKNRTISDVCVGVLDEEFYARKYPDIAGKEVWHFAQGDGSGGPFRATCRDGTRQGSAEFYAPWYKAKYGNLTSDGSYESLAQEWLNHGKAAGRQGSADFSIVDYRAANPDLWPIFDKGGVPDWLSYWDHWLNSGINEGRPINKEFQANEYLQLYPDLQALLGANNYPAAFDHWVITGKAEGRKGSFHSLQ